MALITLTTDWNKSGYYGASIKGKILTSCTNVTIIDISHDVQPFNKMQAAFILRNCYRNFPAGTIHIVGITSGDPADMQPIIVCAAGQYFISWNNGIFGLLFPGSEAERIISAGEFPLSAFPESDILTVLACKIANGEKPENLGSEIHDFRRDMGLQPAFDKSSLSGNILFFDSYGNGITNITRDLFERAAGGRAFTVYCGDFQCCRISESYHDCMDNEPFVLFNSLGVLETGLKYANLKTLVGLENNALIRIVFYD